MGKECPLSLAQVDRACTALLTHVEGKKGKEQSLLQETDTCSLIITLRKIPTPVPSKPKRIPLKHSLHSEEDSEVCLFTRDDKETTQRLLAQKGVTGIAKVISLDKLKKKYKSHESKRQLSAMYDLFLCDARIYHLLPRYLGKKFFEKKKRPYPINMHYKNLGEEIGKARNATYLYLGRGACSALLIGHTGMTSEMLSRNIMAVGEALSKEVARGWSNIQSAHLKTVDSTSLPLFVTPPKAATKLPKKT